MEVVIVGAARTPLGGFQGSLSGYTAPELGGFAIKAALERSKVKPDQVCEVLWGNVCSANIGQAPSTQAALKGGLPESVPCTMINKVCSSGLKAVMLAAQSISLGQNQIVIAGGMESMTNVPYYAPGARNGLRMGDAKLIDGMIIDGLWDPYNNFHMGICAEICAEKYQLSREDMDNHAKASHARARAAAAAGWPSREIVPVPVPAKRGAKSSGMITQDEGPLRFDEAKLVKLNPAFKRDGTGRVTAGNSSPVTDGAAALVLASRAKAEELGLPIIATIRGYADANQDPKWFTTTPSIAIPKALERAGIPDVNGVCYWELNEAFSAVALANGKLLNIPQDKMNVHGGAVALGHPIGASGARILVSLLNVLEARQGKVGCAAICNGGGGASAVVVELGKDAGAYFGAPQPALLRVASQPKL